MTKQPTTDTEERELSTTPQERHIIEHSLGLSHDRKRSYRNHFATDERGGDYKTIAGLCNRGLMEKGRQISGGMYYFHVTEAGKKSLGYKFKED